MLQRFSRIDKPLRPVLRASASQQQQRWSSNVQANPEPAEEPAPPLSQRDLNKFGDNGPQTATWQYDAPAIQKSSPLKRISNSEFETIVSQFCKR